MNLDSLSTKTIIIASIIFSTFSYKEAQAQVKVGSNPTVISNNVNLEVEAGNGVKTVVKKGTGNVGINTTEPAHLLHVHGTSDGGHNIYLDRDHGNSSITLRSEGGIIISRKGESMSLAPHVGGYLDLIGRTDGSPGWRVAQFKDFFAIAQQSSNQLNAFPFYIHNTDGYITIGASDRLGNGLLSVNGLITSKGYGARNGNGTNSIIQNYAWNISYDGTNARLWINDSNQGIFQFATTSDYRLKKNVSTIETSAIERIKQLRTVNFEYKDIDENFKSNNIKHEGFIAHELKEIIPSAVTGEKDAVDIKGNILPQTVNAVPIIAVLTKAIQELEEKIEKLESENGQLKASVVELSSITARLAEIEAKLPSTKPAIYSASLSSK